MKIRTLSENSIVEEIKKPDFLTEVSNVIFSICKTSDEFKKENDSLKETENILISLEKKIYKQESLIEKAKAMKESFIEKNKMLDNENLETRSKLLEQLGSQL